MNEGPEKSDKTPDNGDTNYLAGIHETRSRLVDRILFLLSLLAPLLVIVSLSRAIDIGWRHIYLLHILVVGMIIIAVVFKRWLSYRIRTYILLGVFLIVGVAGLSAWGLIGHGVVVLLVFASLTGVVLGARAGMIAVTVGVAFTMVMGTAVYLGVISFPFDQNEYATSVTPWLLAIAVLVFLGMVLVLSIGRVQDNLQTSLITLSRRTAELENTNRTLQTEIEERKRAEDVLGESERKYRLLTDNASDVIWTMDLNGQFTYVSPSIERMAGFTHEEALQNKLEELLTPDSLKKVEDKLAEELSLEPEARSAFVVMELQQYTRDGGIIDTEASATWVLDENGGIIGVQGVTRDITDRKQAEEALRESEQKYRSLFEYSGDANFIMSVSEERGVYFVDCNSSSLTLFGCTERHQIVGKRPEDFSPPIQPDGRSSTEKVRQLAMVTMAGNPQVFEWEHRRLDGTPIFVEAVLSRIDLKGIPHMQAVVRDITGRKRAEDALRESEQMAYALLNATTDVAMLLDPDGAIVAANESTAKNFRVTTEELFDKSPFDFMPPDVSERRWKVFQELVAGKKPIRFEDENQGRYFYNSLFPILDDNGNLRLVAVFTRDITEHKQAEEHRENLQAQLSQAQKVEAIGRLAGNVAHDLNNLLSPILGYGEMLLLDFNPDDRRRGYVDEIVRAGSRARDLVQQLLAFGRRQVLEAKPLNLNNVVSGFEKLLRRTIREDIEIEIIKSPDIWNVMADDGQIELVIMNLAVNAQGAMPEGGRLTIETALVMLDEDYAAKHADAQPGEYVMLAVSDTGCGMDDETRKHIFEPFFTTKGKLGSGLGLATVHGIVKQHGGNIWVYSEPGKGTIFKVYLPVSEETRVEEETIEKTTVVLEGSETILLVEDDEQVRDLSQSILKRQGYTVLVAKNGPDALAALAEHDGLVHLLLTDVVMPGMNGKELFVKAAEKYPGLKVLYMSGYTDDIIAHHGVLEESTAFIQKPFTIQTLAAKVREVLEQD